MEILLDTANIAAIKKYVDVIKSLVQVIESDKGTR